MHIPRELPCAALAGRVSSCRRSSWEPRRLPRENLYAVQTQSYGSEARGGQCQAELIIDKKAINSPVAEKKNLLVAMFQTAYEKYIPTLEEDGVLVIDPGSGDEPQTCPGRAYA